MQYRMEPKNFCCGAYIFEFHETRHVLKILFGEIHQVNEMEYSIIRTKALDNIFSERVRRDNNSEWHDLQKGHEGRTLGSILCGMASHLNALSHFIHINICE
jgi:hypothetical protein